MQPRRSPLWTFLSLAALLGGCPSAMRRDDGTGPVGDDQDPLPTQGGLGEEVCGDGNDNDLDGHADEDCGCTYQETQDCYLGDPGTRGVGACATGTQVCRGNESTEFASFGECVGAVGPSPEVCDGIDNDCNGHVDDSGMCDQSPPEAICPPDTTARALQPVRLEGGCSDEGGDCAGYDWSVVSAPGGSVATLDPADVAATTFVPDLAGDYTLRLTVHDQQGNFDDCDVGVNVPNSDGLRVEVYWNDPDRSCGADDWEAQYPDCDDSDVDLHMINASASSWFGTDDCYFATCKPESHAVTWDGAGDGDDPFLDIDDVEGHGPENINIESPAAGETYSIGVHYWSADTWEGGVEVYLKIYCGGAEPVDEFGPIVLPEQDAFWRVADVRFGAGAGACLVTAVDRDGADLTDQDVARAGR